jgi:hypothetical protein
MKNSTDGARIKVWPGLNPENPKPDQGGGSGRVRNITYEQFHNWAPDARTTEHPGGGLKRAASRDARLGKAKT